MFRLTAVLLFGLYAVLVIWGEPVSDGVAVTRSDTSPALASVAAATPPPAETRPARDLSDAEALRLALAAGERTAPRAASAAADVAAVGTDQTPAPNFWYVTGSRVNLRAGPSSGTAIVGGVSLGDRAEILSDPAEPWTRIRTANGIEGWIFSRFISETPA
jgi:uncharacterized protein YgiM (DUF1202 family)